MATLNQLAEALEIAEHIVALHAGALEQEGFIKGDYSIDAANYLARPFSLTPKAEEYLQ